MSDGPAKPPARPGAARSVLGLTGHPIGQRRARERRGGGGRLGAATISTFACLACAATPDGSGPAEPRAAERGPAAALAVRPASSAAQFDLAAPAADYSAPDLARGADGSLGIAWLAFDGQGDHVMAAILRDDRWETPIRVTSERGSYLTPRLAPAPGGFLVVWAAKLGAQYDLHGALVGAAGAGAVERLTHDPGSDAEPVLAAAERGEVWLAWEAFRAGRLDIFARRLDGQGWGPELRVTDHPRSDVQPSLGFDSRGRPWVAWMSWRDGESWNGNYEIYAARLDGEGPGGAVRVSTAPGVDMYPELVALDSGLALLWTRARLATRTIDGLSALAYNQWSDKRYQVAFLDDGGQWLPPRELRPGPAGQAGRDPRLGDRPTPVAGPAGQLWFLFPQLVSADGPTWAMQIARVSQDGADDPVDVSFGASGPGERFAAASRDGYLWTAESVADGQARRWLRVRSLVLDSAAAARPRATQPGPPSAASTIPASRGSRPGGDRRPRVDHGPRRWQAYFGNLHHHSDYSLDRRGANGTASQAFRAVFDIAELDFAALTDHVEGLSSVDWWEIRKITDLWNRPGRFVTFPSYEWTSSLYGHKNVVFPDGAVADQRATFPALEHTPQDLWTFLGDRPAITIPHHVSHGLARPTDWSFRNDRFQRLVEIFQARGNYEYDGAPYQRRDLRPPFVEGHSVRDALGLGHRLGIIASPDHGGGMGLAGVWAEELSRPSIFEALRSRRSFGTTGAKMALFLTVAGAPQGSEIDLPVEGGLQLSAVVQGTAPGLELTLVVDGREREHWGFENASEARIEWRDPDPPPDGTRYYYLRARQADGHIGWTSPVWVSAAR